MPADGGGDAGVAAVLAYHDRTKHHFHRFAASTGYLDWATQPDPFRRYAGAPLVALPHEAASRPVAFDDLPTLAAEPLSLRTVGECLRCAMGLSAWKQYGAARWALRVNPSSGNLHPTEAYVVGPGLATDGWSVCHYAPKEHVLEVRAQLGGADADLLPPGVCLVALTSIHWREAWKYGERAFRYCQHDVGHALGALRYAAALLGWRVRMVPGWSDADLSAMLGVDQPRPDGVEPEHPDCLVAVGPGDVDAACDPGGWVRAARAAAWAGVPNQLSPGHTDWPAIDLVAEATHRTGPDAGREVASGQAGAGTPVASGSMSPVQAPAARAAVARDARALLLQRRSAVAFDGRGELSRAAFATMVGRLMPSGAGAAVAGSGPPPWDLLRYPPQVHLVWFIHRVEGVAPGVYAQVRDAAALPGLHAGLREDLLWEPAGGLEGFYLLAPFDCRSVARRLSCDQEIASDGYFGMAMLARVGPALAEFGPWFYRHLFWECGMVGQVLYLEAEAAGGRATGIGCYYDDGVHDVLGIHGHDWQSLYHFSMGAPVEDARLTTQPGYAWE